MANTTFNPSDKSANVTLSGGNLVATNTGQGLVRTLDKQISGKFYFEFTFANSSSGYFAGVANGMADLSNSVISAVNTAAFNGGGTISVNGVTQSGSLGTIPVGGTGCVAVDFTALLIWFRNGAAGNWNGSGTANPAIGIGGFSIASINLPGTTFAPVCGVTGGGLGPITGNFGDSTFVGAVPSGFTNGFTAGATFTTNLAATQTFIEHWAVPATTDVQLTQAAVEHWAIPNPPLVLTSIILEEWAAGAPEMWLTTVAIEEWAQVPTINTQLVLTQIVLEEWTSVAEASTVVPGTLTAAGVGALNAVGVTVTASPAGGPMVILMM